jgi:hypothetical protein
VYERTDQELFISVTGMDVKLGAGSARTRSPPLRACLLLSLFLSIFNLKL